MQATQELRTAVRNICSAAAERACGKHACPVGRGVAESIDSPHRFLAHAVLIMAVLAMTERQCASQSSDDSAAAKPDVKQVFSPPSEAELSKLERPELRLELLKMVSEDQVARSAGT